MPETRAFYLHGLPGHPDELNAFQSPASKSNITALSRLETGNYEDSLNTLAAQLSNFPSVHLIGFSLGAMTALKLAAKLPETVEALELIAPAAPLSLGNFLPHMDGRQIFKAAQNQAMLSALVALQSGSIQIAPNMVTNAMFSSSATSDRTLLNDEDFRDAIVSGLKHSVLMNAGGYKSELRAYVKDWASVLARVTCSVTLWHGSTDTWAPIAMSEALANRLPEATLHRLPDLGHYSALKHFFETQV